MTSAGFDRIRIGREGNFQQLVQYHEHVRLLKQADLGRRAVLGAEYLDEHADHDSGYLIPRDVGILSVDLSGRIETEAALEEAKAIIAEHMANPVAAKGSVEYSARGGQFGVDSAAVRLARSPQILCPIIRYFGMLPILAEIMITRATAKELLKSTTHMYHRDPDDVTQIKVFIHVSDVDEECGPFHALPADLSERANEELGYPRGRIMDDQVEKVVGAGKAIPSIGKAGTATFCDTTRCLHYGGRPPSPGKPVRELLLLRYVLPTCVLFPQHEDDGERRILLPELEPEPGNVRWNALIGAELA